jgi:hypothetical protein
MVSCQLGAAEFRLCDLQSTHNSGREWPMGRHLVVPAVSSSPARGLDKYEARSSRRDGHWEHVLGGGRIAARWSGRGQHLPRRTAISRSGRRSNWRAFGQGERHGGPRSLSGVVDFDEPASVQVAVAFRCLAKLTNYAEEAARSPWRATQRAAWEDANCAMSSPARGTSSGPSGGRSDHFEANCLCSRSPA